MIKDVFNEDIAFSEADVVVNASNGFGYMGGNSGVIARKLGVAESLHFVSGGLVEALAMGACQAKGKLGYAPGSIFITAAPGLRCKYVIHAVTMRLPGSKARLRTIKKLVPKIAEKALEMGAKTVAVPMLGAGTGKLEEEDVYDIFRQVFDGLPIEFLIYRTRIHV